MADSTSSTAGLLNLDDDIRDNIVKHCRKSPKFFALLNFWRNFGDPLLVPLFDALDLEFALASPRREDLAIKIITRLIERGKPDPELKLTRWEIQLALIMEQRFKKYEADKAKKTASQKRIYEAEINGKEDGQVEHEDDPMDVDDQDLDSEKDEDMWADEEDAIGKDDMELKRLRQHEWDIRGNKYSVLTIPTERSKGGVGSLQEADGSSAMDARKNAAVEDHSGDLRVPPGMSQPGQ
eukprot:jgi/Pico_ML_1/52354/g3068.t1